MFSETLTLDNSTQRVPALAHHPDEPSPANATSGLSLDLFVRAIFAFL